MLIYIKKCITQTVNLYGRVDKQMSSNTIFFFLKANHL